MRLPSPSPSRLQAPPFNPDDFSPGHSSSYKVSYLGMDWALSLIFMLDMLKNFHVGYETVDGYLNMRRDTIARVYLTSWFVVDFVGERHHRVAAASPPRHRRVTTA